MTMPIHPDMPMLPGFELEVAPPEPVAPKVAKVATPNEATLARRERRARKERELAARIRDLPERRYGLIYADPPWQFEPYSRLTGLERDASNHYPVMTLEKIKALDVPSIVASDCVLALWGTAPMLPQALQTMAAWGFDYKSQLVWIKDKIGLGFWFRGRHEILLIGTHGHPPAPAPGMNVASVLEAKVREHSRKPDATYAILESYFPTVPKVELFARSSTPRPGWELWGAEAGAPPSRLPASAVVGSEPLELA
jgi:N6-adenosine-specific RNA methylase IME4